MRKTTFRKGSIERMVEEICYPERNAAPSKRYIIQEFVAGRWFNIASYKNGADAKAAVAKLGYKFRVKKVN